ncbi:integrin alpha-PS2 isoform X2 [Anopheles darlingi]|uniref:integrin alpha-PS2 isoform X2 n=1 Tax=Anopheles darlingi TaxID=43151 RepID=UPI00210026B5|nr:integrin alpha-PS2 isoform X2 [Anopheles darlingi]
MESTSRMDRRASGRSSVTTTTTTAVNTLPVLLPLLLLVCCWTGPWGGPVGTAAFNLDTINFILQEGDPNSMFGFSVALHREQNKSWVIVGAPTANTTQPDVIEGGAVYRCDIYDDTRCSLVPFDNEGNRMNDQNEQIDTKSNQWFGATVVSAGIDGPLVACAPRYVFHQLQPRKAERVEPVGTCHIAKNNMREFQELSPCRTSYWGYHRQGSCQAGFSAALTKDGTRVFIGAPGSYYWQGQMYSINTDVVFPYKPPRYGHFGEGQIYSYSLNNPKDKVYKTLEDKKDEDDSYLGYSATTGDFNGDGTQGVAVGKPRGAGLLGKVLIYAWNMTNQQNITGEQIGAYFGYSLAAVDVDGDGLDDLIIGAPMHTEPNNEGKYETGRVYIIYHGSGADQRRFGELETRDGTMSRARFGLSVCSLADINLDGYGDFAVGAPYDGPSGRGAVYVFYGARTGTLAKPSQVLQAEELTWGVPGRLSTFGFSLAGGIDLDGNQYPDLAVGAYDTDKVLVFRSRPVATMEASTLFETENKLISLDERNCTLERTQKQVACTVVNSCLKYGGINVPPMLDIEIGWTLDARSPRSPRLFFLNDEGRNVLNQSMRLYRGKLECRSERVYVGESVRDKITPLEVEMRYGLRESRVGGAASTLASSRQRRPRLNVEPVLDANRGTVQRDSINIQKNCGPDNVCIPDLRLDIKSVDEYLLGSNNLLTIEVLITNRGEDAFEAGFYMAVPAGLDFRRVDRLGEVRDVPVLCTAPSHANNGTLRCDIGNPLASGKVVNFKVILAPSFAVGMAPSYDFYLEANSTNPELGLTLHNNVVRKSIGISIRTNLALSGVSLPDEFLYNYTEYKPLAEATSERDLGPQIVHIYEIRNEGPSTIDEAEFFVLWPTETIDQVPLMYLLNQPETHGNIQCQPTEYANSRHLALDTVLARKSFLDKVGVSGTSYSSVAGGTGRLTRLQGLDGATVTPSISFSSGGAGGATGSAATGASRTQTDAGAGGRGRYYESSERRFQSSTSGGGAAANDSGYERRQQQQHSQSSSSSSSSSSVSSASGGSGVAGSGSYATERRQESNYGSGSRQQGQSYGAAAAGGQGQHQQQLEVTGGERGGTSSSSSTSTFYASRNRTIHRTEDGPGGRVTYESTEYRKYGSDGGIGPNSLGISVGKEGSYAAGTGSSSSGSTNSYSEHQYGGSSGRFVATQGTSGGQSLSVAGASTTGVSSASGSGRRRMMSQQDGEGLSGSHRASGGLVTDFLPLDGSHRSSGHDGDALDAMANRFRTDYTSSGSTSNTGRTSSSSSTSHTSSSSTSSSSSSGSTTVQQQQQQQHMASGAGTGSYHHTTGGTGHGQQHYQGMSSNGTHMIYTSGSTAYGGVGDEDEDSYDDALYDRSEEAYEEDGGTDVPPRSSAHDYIGSHHHHQQQHHQQQQQYSGQQYAGTTIPHLSKQHLNQGHETVDQKFRYYQRFDQRRQRRQATTTTSTEYGTPVDRALEEALTCHTARCAMLRCVAGPIGNKDVAFIALRTRAIAHTLHQLSASTPLHFSTKIVARVTKLPYIGQPKEKPIKTHEIKVLAVPEPIPKPDVVPLWIVVLAACAGTLILLLLIYLLSKCGFFERNRPTDSSERQPLNRNA